MLRNSMKLTAAVLVAAAFSSLALLLVTPAGAQQPTVTRKVLLKEDSPTPGYKETWLRRSRPAGGKAGTRILVWP